MSEVLPIKALRDEDAIIFGSLNVALAKLIVLGLPVARGIVVTPPVLKLKTTLEYFDFGSHEMFKQSLKLIQKELEKIEVPDVLVKETKTTEKFYVDGQTFKSTKSLWQYLLSVWIQAIRERLWQGGFKEGLTEGLESKVVAFVDKVEASGESFFDSEVGDSVINVSMGKLYPEYLKKLSEIIEVVNKKILLSYKYDWIFDHGIKLVGVKAYTPVSVIPTRRFEEASTLGVKDDKPGSAIKIFYDLSSVLTVEKNIDGIYIETEKIFDLNRPQSSYEELLFKLIESAATIPNKPVLVKLADISEGMGKVRGALRLIHQDSLFNPLVEAILFCRNKKEMKNIHLVIPFIRANNELMEIKRKLASKKLTRKNNLQIWLELAVPENIINLEKYLLTGVDGVVLNLDELVSFLNGFDKEQPDLLFYKHEIDGLIGFLADALKILHKSKTPFIASGSLNLHPQILEFLAENGVYGVVTPPYEAHSMTDHLRSVEKHIILNR